MVCGGTLLRAAPGHVRLATRRETDVLGGEILERGEIRQGQNVDLGFGSFERRTQRNGRLGGRIENN